MALDHPVELVRADEHQFDGSQATRGIRAALGT